MAGSKRFTQFFSNLFNKSGQHNLLDGQIESDDSITTAVLDAPDSDRINTDRPDIEGINIPDAPVLSKKAAKEAAMAKLERGYTEMLDLMATVRTRMDEQGERQERLLQIMEGLPEALKSLPEASRNQARMLQAMQSHMDRQSDNNQKLTGALTDLARSQENHDQTMESINKQLTAQQQTGNHMLDSFTAINGTLSRMSGASEASTSVLQDLSAQTRGTEETVRELFQRNQRHMTIMSVVSWTLAIVALTVAGYVAVSVGRMSSTPAPAVGDTPPPITQPVGKPGD